MQFASRILMDSDLKQNAFINYENMDLLFNLCMCTDVH